MATFNDSQYGMDETSTQSRQSSTRPNANLPDFYNGINDYNVLRSYLICKNDNSIISHFVSVPIDEYNAFLVNHRLTPNERKEWEDRNLLAIPKDPKENCGAMKKMTVQQLKKLNTKLRRKTPQSREEAYNQLQAMRQEELGFRDLLPASDRRRQNLFQKAMVVIRFITTIFSDTFRSRLGEINHNKSHLDHETNNTYKGFFDDVSSIMMIGHASEHLHLHPCGVPEYEAEYDHYLNVDALGEQFPLGPFNDYQKEYAAPKSLMIMMNDLIKVYKKMGDNMSVSGSHANDPFLYAGSAIASNNLKSSITEQAAYYFFMQCTSWPVIVANLTSALPENVRCANSIPNNLGITDTSEGETTTSKKRKAMAEHTTVLSTINTNISTLTQILDRSETKTDERENRVRNDKRKFALDASIANMKLALRKDRKLENKYITQMMACADDQTRNIILKAIESLQKRIADQTNVLSQAENNSYLLSLKENAELNNSSTAPDDEFEVPAPTGTASNVPNATNTPNIASSSFSPDSEDESYVFDACVNNLSHINGSSSVASCQNGSGVASGQNGSSVASGRNGSSVASSQNGSSVASGQNGSGVASGQNGSGGTSPDDEDDVTYTMSQCMNFYGIGNAPETPIISGIRSNNATAGCGLSGQYSSLTEL